MNEKNKKERIKRFDKALDNLVKQVKAAGNPNWGGNRLECKVIQRRADQWCKDNGYPIQRRKYWQKRKWTHNRIYEQQ